VASAELSGALHSPPYSPTPPLYVSKCKTLFSRKGRRFVVF